MRVNSPVGASLLCITALLILAILYVGIAWVVRNAPTLVEGVKEAMLADTPAPLPTLEPTSTPVAVTMEPALTPALGTPEPAETEAPTDPDNPGGTTPSPVDPDAPLYGVTIGIDPMRDKSSKYKAEADYNLAFANKLAAYLTARGATVVLTRDSSNKTYSDGTRAKVIRDAKCDLAIRLLCNHITNTKTDGTYVQTLKKHQKFAQFVIDEYAKATGMDKRKDKGVEIKDVGFLDSVGCPAVQLIMGHWTNSAELKRLRDDAFQEKMMEGIYNAILKQISQN